MDEERCSHQWIQVSQECTCWTFSSRGTGQYNDPCYGACCPCDGHVLTTIYECTKCGERLTEA